MKTMIEKIFSARMLALLLAICATSGAWAAAPVPVVVWDGAAGSEYDFSGLTKGIYTLNLNSQGSVSGDKSYVQIGSDNQKAGVTITSNVAGAFGTTGCQTVIIKGSDFKADQPNRAIIGLIRAGANYANDNNVKVAIANGYSGYYTYINNGLYAGYGGSRTWTGNHIIAMTYSSVDGAKGFVDGINYASYSSTADSTFTSPSGVVLGGMDIDGSTKIYAQTGMKIYAIAIFDSELTKEQIANYAFPSSSYQTFDYASHMFTWTTAANGSSSIDMGGGSSRFKLFDKSLGADTTEYTGNVKYSEYNSGLQESDWEQFWTSFCYVQYIVRQESGVWVSRPPNYSDPGAVLRLVSGYHTAIGGTFAPFALGGLLVEDGAVGYNFTQGTSGRNTILGDPRATGGVPTWFVANESVAFNRTGWMYLTGTINFDIAENCAVNLNNPASGGNDDYAPVLYGSLGYKGDTQVTGGELIMRGLGNISVRKLTASGAKLDYSNLTASRMATPGTASYIQGNLVIDGNTLFAFPAGMAKNTAYSLCSGTLTVTGLNPRRATITIGDQEIAAILTFADNTLSYEPIYVATASGDTAIDELEWTPAISSISDLDGARVEINGSGKITGLTVTPASISLASTVTLDMTNAGSPATMGTSGTYLYTSGYPTSVPSGYTYQYEGSDDSANPATQASVAVSGTLKTSGYLSLTSFSVAASGTLEVLSGKTTIANSSGSRAFKGAMTVDEDGYLVYASNDLLDYAGSTTANIYGTLEISGSSTRFLNESASMVLNFYAGSTVKGSGFINLANDKGLNVKANPNNPSATKASFQLGLKYNYKNSTSTITVDSGVELELSGSMYTHNGNTAGGITKAGEGKMTFTSGCTTSSFPATLTVSAGEAEIACTFGGNINVGSKVIFASTGGISGTKAISGSGEVVGNQTFPLPGSGFTGTLTINGIAAPGMTSTAATTIYGSVLNVNSGAVVLTGAVTTLPATIDIASGAILAFTSSSVSSLSLTLGTWDGQLYISNDCSALATLTIDAGTARSLARAQLLLTSSGVLDTVNIGFTEISGEGGTITLTGTSGISEIDGRTYNYSVLRKDGETVSADYEDGTLTYAPAISGSATLFDITFRNNSADVGKQTGTFTYKAVAGAALKYDTVATFNNAEWDDTTGVYIKHHPYIDSAYSTFAGLSDFTAVVVGQMSPTHNTEFIHFGSSKDSRTGLLITTTENDNEVIIAPNTGASVDTENAVKMTVPNAASCRHAYVIIKSGTTFEVWVDGVRRGNFTVAADYQLGNSSHSGIQVGSDFGGIIKNAAVYNNVPVNESETGVINVIRVFDYAITEAQAEAIFAAYPYSTAAGIYERTLDSNGNLSSAGAWAKVDDEENTYAIPLRATVDEVVYAPNANITATADVTLTANADLEIDTLTIKESESTLTVASDGEHSIIVSGSALVYGPLKVVYGALDLDGTPVQLGADGSLAFDCSALDVSGIYTVTRYQLTGLMDRNDAKVSVIPPAAPGYTVTLEYTTNKYYELVVTPDHAPGDEIYWISGTYWSDTNENTARFYLDAEGTDETEYFEGDMIVIPNTTTRYFGTIGDGVKLKYDCDGTIVVYKSGDIGCALKNANVTVESGTTLSFEQPSWSPQPQPEIVGCTFTGGGNITVPSGVTLTVSGVVSSAISFGGAGTVNVGDGATLSLTGSAAVTSTLQGSGTITYATALGSSMSLGTWTGTVVLPQITNVGATGFYFNWYGKAGSTIEIANGFSGWLNAGSDDTRNVKANVVISNNKSLIITGTNGNTTYGFAKVSGNGNLTVQQTYQPTSITIGLLEGYTGTLATTDDDGGTPTAITVNKVKLASTPAAGDKLIATSTPDYVNIATGDGQGVYVGDIKQNITLMKKSDGIYVAASSSTTGEGSGAVTTVETDSSATAVEASVTVEEGYAGTIVIPSNVKKLNISGATVEDSKLKLKVAYNETTTIYENVLTRDGSGNVSLKDDAKVGDVKVKAEVKTGDAEHPPMAMTGSAPSFTAKTIPGLYYAVKAASNLSDLDNNKYKYGEAKQATGDTLSLDAPTFPGTVQYYRIDTATTENDLTRYIISTDQVADTPVDDRIFEHGETGWNHDVYRIPAMAATPDGTTVMGIFDARYNYQDLGVRLTSEGYNADTASPDHYTGIDIAGCYSLDSGASWSGPQIMIDVPNASDPKTGDKTTALTKAMELGDPCIVYDSANSKFIMMGITGGGLTTPTNTTSNAILADVVMYECTLASVQSGNPTWVGPVSVKAAIETALQTADTAANNFTYPSSFTGDGYLGILEGPGHAFVTRAACGDIPANTVVWPMQYVIRQGGRWTLKGGNFAAWKDGSGNWHTTKLVPNSGDDKNYVTQEGCITQLDNGDLLYMCKKIGGGTRPFYKSTDGVIWTFLNEITIAGSEAHQGSILRLGSGSDGHSRYAAVFATGTLRSDIKAFIGTDDGSGSVTWDTENPITVWAGATGTADDDGNGPHGNLVYGYNSLVMLDATTLGVLSEANGHIYFTKVDVSSALR